MSAGGLRPYSKELGETGAGEEFATEDCGEDPLSNCSFSFRQWSLAEKAAGGLRMIEAPFPSTTSVTLPRPNGRELGVPAVIIDSNPLFRAGLVHILTDTSFRITAACASFEEFPSGALDHNPALLLLGSVDKPASEWAIHSKQSNPGLRVVVLVDSLRSGELMAVLESGADSILLKNETSPEMLLKSLELTLLGVTVIPCIAAPCAVEEETERHDGAAKPDAPIVLGTDFVAIPRMPLNLGEPNLSERERLILQYLIAGASNKVIARDVGIAESTVKVHVKSLLRKLRVSNRTQAAMWGINQPDATATKSGDCCRPA